MKLKNFDEFVNEGWGNLLKKVNLGFNIELADANNDFLEKKIKIKKQMQSTDNPVKRQKLKQVLDQLEQELARDKEILKQKKEKINELIQERKRKKEFFGHDRMFSKFDKEKLDQLENEYSKIKKNYKKNQKRYDDLIS